MTLSEFLTKEKITRSDAEAQAYVYYNRVSVNGEDPRSPFIRMKEGNIVILLEYDTNTMKNARILQKIYREESLHEL